MKRALITTILLILATTANAQYFGRVRIDTAVIQKKLRFDYYNNTAPRVGEIWRSVTGDTLWYRTSTGTEVFFPSQVGGGSGTLGGLTDVDTAGKVNDSVIKYNSTSGKWEVGTDVSGGGGFTWSINGSATAGDSIRFYSATPYIKLTKIGNAVEFEWDTTYAGAVTRGELDALLLGYLKNADSTRMKAIIVDSAAAIRATIDLLRGQDTARAIVREALKADKATTIQITANSPATASGGTQDLSGNRIWVIGSDTSIAATIWQVGQMIQDSSLVLDTSGVNGGMSLGSVIAAGGIPVPRINATGDTLFVDSLRTVSGGSGETNTASNLDGAGVGVFKQKTGVNLEFKRLKGEWGITVTDRTDSVGLKVDSTVVATKGDLLLTIAYTDTSLAWFITRSHAIANYLKNADSADRATRTYVANLLLGYLSNGDSTDRATRTYVTNLLLGYLSNADSADRATRTYVTTLLLGYLSNSDSTDKATRTFTGATYQLLNNIGKRLYDSTGITTNSILKFDGTKWVIGTDNTSVGATGHVIVKSDGTASTQRDSVQFGEAFIVTDDGTKTVVNPDSNKIPILEGPTSGWLWQRDASHIRIVLPAVDTLEFSYLDGVTGPIQTALNAKAPIADPAFTGSVQVPNGTNPTTDAAGEIAVDTDDSAIETYDGTASRIIPSRQLANYVILFPDSVQTRTDDVQLAHFPAEVYPFGITIFYVAISASASCTDTHVIEEWSDAVGTSQGTVESIALSGVSKAESTSIDDGAIAADAYLNINLDGTTDNLNQITVTIGYYVNPGD